MKNETVLPFSDGIKKIKYDFKKMIDEMPDEDFLNMMHFLMDFEEEFYDDFDDEEYVDEEFENPFSGEMTNFKCPECKKISAYPIEIAHDIYETTKEKPQIDCYYCDCHKASPIYYQAPDGKIFKI